MKAKKGLQKISLMVTFTMVSSMFTGFAKVQANEGEVKLPEDLIISEYVEGSGAGNKALEFYNGTKNAINLKDYSIELYMNGATTVKPTNILNLKDQVLDSGKTHVIAHSGITVKDAEKVFEINDFINFSGDDVIVLKKGDKVIDSVGKIGSPKGVDFGKDKTFIRNKNVIKGDINPNDEFSWNAEWKENPKDYLEDLGKHTIDISGTPTKPIPVTKINLQGNEEVEVGKTKALNLSFEPNDATDREVIWKSSDESIVTVDNTGKIIGIKTGSADILVMLQSNNNIKATCKVTVRDAAVLNTIPISDARNKNKGEEVMVKGVVTFNDRNQTVHIQDDTGAIAVSNKVNSTIDLSKAIKGQELLIKGNKDIFKNLDQVQVSELQVLGSKELPTPKVLSIKEANTGNYESQLIKIEKAVIDLEKKTLTQGTDVLNIYFIPKGISVKTGDTVDVVSVIGVYDTKIQIYGSSATFTKIEEEDNKLPVIEHNAITEVGNDKNLKVEATVSDNKKVEKVSLNYRTKGKSIYKTLEMKESSGQYLAEIPYAELSTDGIEYFIEATDGKNKATKPEDTSNPYYVKVNDVDTVGPEIFNILPLDGSSVGKNARPEIKAYFKDKSGVAPFNIKLSVDGIDVSNVISKNPESVIYTPTTDLSKGAHVVKLTLKDNKGNISEKEWRFFVGEEITNFYFGQLHAHTDISDGKGSLDEAYQWARDKAKADYIAVTDHSNWFDNDVKANINDGSMSSKWVKAHEIADKYNEDGKFTAIYGYEMTWSGSTGGWGHMNTFNTKGFETRTNSKMDLKTYYDTIAGQPQSISQLNHPGKTFGDFADFGFYSKAADNVVNLIEVGNGEGPIRGSGYFPSYEYYTRALDKGWHLAPTNNQDNHKANWITSNTARTVILAREQSRDGLYDAMRAKKVYATEDENVRVNYKVNNKEMGSFLGNPDKLNFSININDPDSTDSISKVSIIANGGVEVTSKKFNSNIAKWDFELSPEYSYYYVRIEEADKDIAVTAPVWVGENVAVGLTKVEADKTLAVTGEDITFTAGVYNNGQDALKDVKVEFFLDEISEKAKIGEQIISSLDQTKSEDVKITWNAKRTGNFTVYVRTVLKVNGADKVFTQSTKVEVVDKDEINRVVIDGSHQNQYVTGNYPGKVEALKALFKNKKSIVQINDKEINDEVLKEVKLLVLSDPQSTADTKYKLNPCAYSDKEVEAIKRFVENGGSIILSSKADYRDGKGAFSNGAQGNKVLEAIGTNLRINDDQVIDNKNNGGQSFRLAFDKFASPLYNLTKNIPEGQKYSFYSGCSVILKEGGDPKKVDFLVKGYDTTETSDADNDNDNVKVKKGEVNVLGAEELQNGAKVVVAGSTFFSDFELSGDNLNANSKIADNIIEWMIPEKPAKIVTIKEFRKDENKDGIPDNLGKRFAIEGTVTAQSEAVQPKNSFFEVIYVQDGTAGITVFGVSKTPVKVGQKVRLTGVVDQYQGDAEIQIKDETKDLQILDQAINIIEPKGVTAKESMLEENEGLLVKVQGKVVKMDDQNIYVDDRTGISRAYVEGYIWDGKDDSRKGKWNPGIEIGDTVSVVGLASEDPEGHRLRVRNTSEIVLVSKFVSLEKIELNATSKELYEGEGFKLEAKILPQNATIENITWKSTDEKVIAVDEKGNVVAKKEGKAEVIVILNGKEMSKCQFIVKKKDVLDNGNSNNESQQKNDSVIESEEETTNVIVGDKDSAETLVKTGSLIDLRLEMLIGIGLIIVGAYLILRKRKGIKA